MSSARRIVAGSKMISVSPWSVSPGSFIREAQRLGLADLKDPEHTGFIPGYDEQIPGVHPLFELIESDQDFLAMWIPDAVADSGQYFWEWQIVRNLGKHFAQSA